MKSYDKKINQLIKMYTQAEKRLINIISTKKVKGHVTDFYEAMLKQVKLELMQLQMKSANYTKDIVNELYLEAYYNSLKMLGISSIGDGFAQLHTQAIELLSDNMINNFAEVNNQVGRRIEDTIRDIGLTDTQMKFATGQTIKQLQNELINSLINTGLGGITDKRGRVIPFTSYAELLSRSIVAETQNTCVLNIAGEHEKDLVKMTQHSTSCPVCVPYEGRVYSISGKDKRFPKLNTIPGFNNGYNNIHPRCRHRITPYIEKYNEVEKDIKNSNKPFEIPKEKEESINKYLEEQKEKARLRNDKKQYERYRQILGDEVPKSLQSFRKIKYNDSKEWELLKDYKKSRESNMISAFTTFNDFKKYRDIIDKDIVGLKTANEIEIKSQSKHFIERVLGTSYDPDKKRPRDGVGIEEIKNTLTNPLKVKEEPKKNSHKFIGEKVTITINPDTGNLIQCNPTDSDLVRRLKNVQD